MHKRSLVSERLPKSIGYALIPLEIDGKAEQPLWSGLYVPPGLHQRPREALIQVINWLTDHNMPPITAIIKNLVEEIGRDFAGKN